MQTETVRKITDALAKRPHTRDQLVTITGLSRATIVNAIRELGLEKVPNTRPAYYVLPLEAEMPGLSTAALRPTARASGSLTVGHRQYADWIERWNGSAERFADTLSGIRIEPDTDPQVLAQELTVAAETLASLAYALQVVATKPDWYTLLGGDLEPKKSNRKKSA